MIDQIAQTPDRYPIAHGTIREAALPDHPYSIFYRFRSGEVVIVAVYHQAREPDGWRRRN